MYAKTGTSVFRHRTMRGFFLYSTPDLQAALHFYGSRCGPFCKRRKQAFQDKVTTRINPSG